MPWSVSRPDSGCRSARPGRRGQPLVPLGVVLHRARAERIEVRVDRHVQRRQVREVPHHLELAQLGQRRRRARPGARRGAARRAARSGTSRLGQDRRARGRDGWSRTAVAVDRACTWIVRPESTSTERSAMESIGRRVSDQASRSPGRRLGQAVDLVLGPLLGHGDQEAVGQLGIPAAQGDPAVDSRGGRPRPGLATGSFVAADRRTP